jgi:hypothetical protein
MPSTSRSSRGKAVAGLGSAIPLAIALLHSAVVPSNGNQTSAPDLSSAATVTPVVCSDDIEDYLACHSEYPTGCNASGKYDAYLNRYKNQVQWSDSQPQKWFTTLDEVLQLENEIPSGLGKNNHSSYLQPLQELGEGKIFGAVGYLYGVKAEGKESCNCQLEPGDDNENVDFHIYLGFDPAIASRIRSGTVTPADKAEINPKSVIVEMTPHYRGRYHPEWTLDAVRNQLGRQVKVTGQLMVDNEHYVKSQDCGRKDHTAACWRATVWELHPVTQFETCQTQNCTSESGEWAPIGQGAASEPRPDKNSPTANRARSR